MDEVADEGRGARRPSSALRLALVEKENDNTIVEDLGPLATLTRLQIRERIEGSWAEGQS